MFDHRERLAGVALGLALAEADDGHESGAMGRRRLGAYHCVVLAVIGAAFRMADDDIAAAGIGQHLGADIAGVGAARLGMAILAAEVDGP